MIRFIKKLWNIYGFVGCFFLVLIGLGVAGYMHEQWLLKADKACHRHDMVYLAVGKSPGFSCTSKLNLIRDVDNDCYQATTKCYVKAFIPNDLNKCDAICLSAKFDR